MNSDATVAAVVLTAALLTEVAWKSSSALLTGDHLSLVSWASYDEPKAVIVAVPPDDDDDSVPTSALEAHRVGVRSGVAVALQRIVTSDDLRLECGGSYLFAGDFADGNVLQVKEALDSFVAAARICNLEGRRGGGARLTHLTLPNELFEVLSQDDSKLVVLHTLDTSEDGLVSLHDLESSQKRCDTKNLPECLKDPHAIYGSTLRVVYDSWHPLCYENEDGELVGLIHDVFVAIANKLNISMEWIPNPEPYVWSGKDVDGNWLGMVGQLQRGEADTSPAGFEITLDRAAAIDNSMSVCRLTSTLFIKAPSRARVSWENYVKEFDLQTWLAIAATSISLMLALHFMTSIWSTAPSAMVLRALIGKGSSFKAVILSSKALYLTTLLFATIILSSYRSAMNSFLAVLLPIYPVKNLQDVPQLTSGITFWAGTSYEDYFQSMPPNTLEGQLYQQYKSDKTARVESYNEALKVVVEGDYALVGEEPIINTKKKFACQVSRVPGYVFSRVSLSIPFSPGSRYTRPFNEELLKMKDSGVIERLITRYLELSGLHEGCREEISGLGFSNVFTPFWLLALGGVTALSASMVERCLRMLLKDSSAPASELQQQPDDGQASLQVALRILNDPYMGEASKLNKLRSVICCSQAVCRK